MKFTISRKLTNKNFSTQISFCNYGESDLTESEEENLIEDLGAPVINLGKLTFEGKFDVIDGKVVESADGDSVSFILNSQPLNVDKGFVAYYSADHVRIENEKLTTKLDTKEKVAEARCLLFEKTVKNAITTALSELKQKRTEFEHLDVPDFTA